MCCSTLLAQSHSACWFGSSAGASEFRRLNGNSAPLVSRIQRHRVEAMPQRETGSLIQPDSLVIRFRHGKRDCLETRCQQGFRAAAQKQASKSTAAERRCDTELCDVRNLRSNARTQHHSDQRATLPVTQHPRVLRLKDTASRKPHNVVQESQRAVQRSVLFRSLIRASA